MTEHLVIGVMRFALLSQQHEQADYVLELRLRVEGPEVPKFYELFGHPFDGPWDVGIVVPHPPSMRQELIAALEAGIIHRRWECTSDKSDCKPEDEDRGYLHDGCHWYWDLWTVEQDKIEALYQGTE